MSPVLFVRRYVFIYIIDQVTYFRYIVGQSTLFSVILESLVSYNFPIFRGYVFFLAVSAHPIFTIKIYREM